MRAEPSTLEFFVRRLVRGHTAQRRFADEELNKMSKVQRLLVARIGVSDTDEDVRNQAALLLADCGTQDDAFRVRALAKDRSWVVRSTVAWAVYTTLGKRGKSILLKLLDDSHHIVRRNAAVTLGDLGFADLIPTLEQKLRVERRDQARAGLLWALVTLGERQYFESLIGIHRSRMNNADMFLWTNMSRLINDPPLTGEELSTIRNAIDEARTGEADSVALRAIDSFESDLNERYGPTPAT